MYGKFFSQGKTMRKYFAFVVAAMILTGCNTIEGIGKDVKKGGEAIEKAAEKAKN
jgi:predicted small secreted protein